MHNIKYRFVCVNCAVSYHLRRTNPIKSPRFSKTLISICDFLLKIPEKSHYHNESYDTDRGQKNFFSINNMEMQIFFLVLKFYKIWFSKNIGGSSSVINYKIKNHFQLVRKFGT